jgi:hypothetical protein
MELVLVVVHRLNRIVIWFRIDVQFTELTRVHATRLNIYVIRVKLALVVAAGDVIMTVMLATFGIQLRNNVSLLQSPKSFRVKA